MLTPSAEDFKVLVPITHHPATALQFPGPSRAGENCLIFVDMPFALRARHLVLYISTLRVHVSDLLLHETFLRTFAGLTDVTIRR